MRTAIRPRRSSRADPFEQHELFAPPRPAVAVASGRRLGFALPMAEVGPDGHASELRREILRSEVQRVQVLAVVLTVLAVTTSTASTCDRPGAADLLGGVAWWELFCPLGALCASMNSSSCPRRRCGPAQDRYFPRYARFRQRPRRDQPAERGHLAPSHHISRSTVFSFWPPMLIRSHLLSTLRLDFWLSLSTGAVAAVQQPCWTLWLLPTRPDRPARRHADLPLQPQHRGDGRWG